MRSAIFVFFASIATLALTGCSDPIQAIDQSVDCHDICTRYRDCYDANYNVDACRSRCENYVHGDGGHGDQANQCDMCLDPRSCTTVAFACGSQCVNIIP